MTPKYSTWLTGRAGAFAALSQSVLQKSRINRKSTAANTTILMMMVAQPQAVKLAFSLYSPSVNEATASKMTHALLLVGISRNLYFFIHAHMPASPAPSKGRTGAIAGCLLARHPRLHRPPEAAFRGEVMGAREKAAVENQQGCCGDQEGRNEDGESCFHAPNMAPGAAYCQPRVLRRLSTKNRRRPLDGFPAEIIIGAGPGVDLGLADPAFEIAGMLVLVLFPRRRIIHSATGAVKFFGGPNAACHGATMRRR